LKISKRFASTLVLIGIYCMIALMCDTIERDDTIAVIVG
jgi:hypothetical protein